MVISGIFHVMLHPLSLRKEIVQFLRYIYFSAERTPGKIVRPFLEIFETKLDSGGGYISEQNGNTTVDCPALDMCQGLIEEMCQNNL